MLYYRLYFLHSFSGHIVRFAEYEAPDDAAARALAAEHEGDQPLELWCQHRKVARFEQVEQRPAGLTGHVSALPKGVVGTASAASSGSEQSRSISLANSR